MRRLPILRLRRQRHPVPPLQTRHLPARRRRTPPLRGRPHPIRLLPKRPRRIQLRQSLAPSRPLLRKTVTPLRTSGPLFVSASPPTITRREWHREVPRCVPVQSGHLGLGGRQLPPRTVGRGSRGGPPGKPGCNGAGPHPDAVARFGLAQLFARRGHRVVISTSAK